VDGFILHKVKGGVHAKVLRYLYVSAGVSESVYACFECIFIFLRACMYVSVCVCVCECVCVCVCRSVHARSFTSEQIVNANLNLLSQLLLLQTRLCCLVENNIHCCLVEYNIHCCLVENNIHCYW